MIEIATRNLLHTIIRSHHSTSMQIAEIGVFKDPWIGTVISGDQDGNNVMAYDGEILYKNVKELFNDKNNVSIVRKLSHEAFEDFSNDTFDMIYIDGDHSYEGVKKDLDCAYRAIKNGGWIVGHDYEMNFSKAKHKYDFGVKQAVDEFCRKYNQKIFAKAMDGCVSFIIRIIKKAHL